MEDIERQRAFAKKPSEVVNRGDDDDLCPNVNYIIKIPSDYAGFEGYCLPLSIILVSVCNIAALDMIV